MVLADGQGLPLGVSLHSASPGEIQLAPETIASVHVGRLGPGRPRRYPDRLIADRGYDSYPFRRWLAARGIELIAPHLSNRRRKHQDGRPLRRYKRRWKIERTMAWLLSYRRVVIRWDRDITSYRAFLHIACVLIVLRGLSDRP
jgi:transposase